MHVVIFEGSRWPTFVPVALSRPVFTLLSGTSTLLEKQVRHLAPSRLTLWVRPELEEHCRVRVVPTLPVPTQVNVPLDHEPALLISGRTLLFNAFEFAPEPAVVTQDTDLIRFAYTVSPGLSRDDVMTRSDKWLKLLDLPHHMPQGRLVETLWDLIHWNEESIVEDAISFQHQPRAHPPGAYHMIHEQDVWLAETTALEPGCVLDASNGPIVIGERARIGANSVLQGPCYIGPYTSLSPLTYIRPGTSIGPMCRIGGVVSNSIVLGQSNKSHEGFLGDSYLGKWVNFGAGTTTSNLKNTYGEVTLKRGGQDVATGRRFLGALVGDHTKTAVLTRLMAGTYLGFNASVAGSSIAPRFLPSFSFWTDKGVEPYEMEKAFEVTRQVFSRRDRAFTEYDQRLMRYVAEIAPKVE